MDFKKHIPEIEKRIGYTFRDKSLLTQAFTRSSFCNEHRARGDRGRYYSNEVLEFFGDSVLSTSIISIFLEGRTGRTEHGISSELCEGDFSVIRSKLSDKRNLSAATARLGLQKFLIMGEGDAKLGIDNEPSVMEDLFESIIGAMYVDCNMDMRTVIASVRDMLDLSELVTPTAASPSAKNALQEWCAQKSQRLPPPRYETTLEEGPDHKKTYERSCFIGDRLVGVGRGKNCKIADTAAAEAALQLLQSEAKKQSTPRINPSEILPKLREMATKRKVASPEFRDLGESEISTAYSPEFIVECRFLGISKTGKGPSKQEASAAAAAEILKELEPTAKERESKAPTDKKSKSTSEKFTAEQQGHGSKRTAKSVTRVKKTPQQRLRADQSAATPESKTGLTRKASKRKTSKNAKTAAK